MILRREFNVGRQFLVDFPVELLLPKKREQACPSLAERSSCIPSVRGRRKNPADHGRKPAPMRSLRLDLALSGFRNRVVLGFAIVVRNSPGRGKSIPAAAAAPARHKWSLGSAGPGLRSTAQFAERCRSRAASPSSPESEAPSDPAFLEGGRAWNRTSTSGPFL